MKMLMLGIFFTLTSCAHSQFGSHGFFGNQAASDSAHHAGQAAIDAANSAAQAAQPMHFAPMP